MAGLSRKSISWVFLDVSRVVISCCTNGSKVSAAVSLHVVATPRLLVSMIIFLDPSLSVKGSPLGKETLATCRLTGFCVDLDAPYYPVLNVDVYTIG